MWLFAYFLSPALVGGWVRTLPIPTVPNSGCLSGRSWVMWSFWSAGPMLGRNILQQHKGRHLHFAESLPLCAWARKKFRLKLPNGCSSAVDMGLHWESWKNHSRQEGGTKIRNTRKNFACFKGVEWNKCVPSELCLWVSGQLETFSRKTYLHGNSGRMENIVCGVSGVARAVQLILELAPGLHLKSMHSANTLLLSQQSYSTRSFGGLQGSKM